MDRECRTCVFWDEGAVIADAHGICRRYPTPLSTIVTHWCGEYATRPTEFICDRHGPRPLDQPYCADCVAALAAASIPAGDPGVASAAGAAPKEAP